MPNFAFAAIWVAEQLKYFEAEGVRIQNYAVAERFGLFERGRRPLFQFLRFHSEGLVLAQLEGAPAIAIQAHNRAMTLSVVLRKAIVDKLGLTRQSPLERGSKR